MEKILLGSGDTIEDSNKNPDKRVYFNTITGEIEIFSNTPSENQTYSFGQMTGPEIKVLYEAEANTNAYTDTEKSKLSGIESGATSDQTGPEIKVLYEAEANTNAYTDTEKSKLSGIESGATSDQTGPEIKALYEAEVNTNAYTDSDKAVLAHVAGLIHRAGYTFKAKDVATGINYVGGAYIAPASSVTLNQGSLTQSLGVSNAGYGAHAFIVLGGLGTTDGSDLLITVSGTSFTDAGVRATGDSEVIYTQGGGESTDDYFETSKKWIGAVVFTLSSTGGTTYSISFNYGFAKYEDFANVDFTISEFSATGLGDKNDSGVDIEVLVHKTTGWTYHASAFLPGRVASIGYVADYVTETEVRANEEFAYKRTGLSLPISGSEEEGFVIRITNSVGNSIAYINMHMGVIFT